MGELVLTEEQQRAVSWLVEQLTSGVSLVALRGLAGTGKTTVIPALRAALAAADIPVSIGSPTHRAAMILKRKGLSMADTLHHHALTPYFTLEYAEAMAFLGEPVPCRLRESGVEAPSGVVPWLIHEAFRTGTDDDHLDALRRLQRRYGAKKALASLGIQGKNHFDGFGPKPGAGCLIIDEASMVGQAQLTLCQEAFPLVCLVGDPGQLPPVNDRMVLQDVPGVDLTHIHRQAADSPILHLAYAARRGDKVWQWLPETPGAIERWPQMAAEAFLEMPLIVWRNDTRRDCTRLIRLALYGSQEYVMDGEPLVCRASSAADRSEGFYNNALFRVVETSALDPRQVTVMPDGSDDPDDARDVRLHLEELDGDRIDPQAVSFRFGYCLTAHTAQGGEWPTVAISQPDLVERSRFKPREGPDDEFPKWLYTAITRAKQCVGFLTQHLFTPAAQVPVGHGPWSPAPEAPTPPKEALPMVDITQVPPTPTPPPSPAAGKAPLFVAAPDPAAIPEAPKDFPPLTDDIPDIAVPASVVAFFDTAPPPPTSEQAPIVDATMGLLEGKITDWVNTQSTATMRTLDRVYEHLASCLDKIAVANDHAQYQLANALDRLSAAGITLHGTPYTATVQAMTPQGFPLTLTVHKGSAEELVQALEGLSAWLQAQGYLAPAAVPFAVDADGDPIPF